MRVSALGELIDRAAASSSRMQTPGSFLACVAVRRSGMLSCGFLGRPANWDPEQAVAPC